MALPTSSSPSSAAAGDEGWQQYAHFVDSITAHLAKSSTTNELVAQLEAQLSFSTDSSYGKPFRNVLVKKVLEDLMENKVLEKSIGDYVSEHFSLAAIQADYRKDNHQAYGMLLDGDELLQNMTGNENKARKTAALRAIDVYSEAIRLAEANLNGYSFEDGQLYASLHSDLFDRRAGAFLAAGHPQEALLDIEEYMRQLRMKGSGLERFSVGSALRLAAAATATFKDDVTEGNDEFKNSSRKTGVRLETIVDVLKGVLARFDEQETGKPENGRPKVSPALKAKLESAIETLSRKLAEIKAASSKTADSAQEMALAFSPHPTLHGASSKVDVIFNQDHGRHVVSTSAISAGDVLFSETPFVTYSSSPHHCSNCFRRLGDINRREPQPEVETNENFEASLEKEGEDAENEVKESDTSGSVGYHSFVPCTTCNRLIFCNDACRTEAGGRFHYAECQNRLSALEAHLGVAYLALRTPLSAGGLGNALEEYRKYLSETENTDKNKTGSTEKTHYQSVLGLLTHAEHHDAHSTVAHLLTVLFLTRALKHFSIKVEGSTSEDDALLAKLFLHHLQQLSTNLLTIFEQDVGEPETGSETEGEALEAEDDDESELAIAVGFYPTVALLNHSCDPDLVPLYVGSRLTLKAARPIAHVGSEVSFCYGPTYRRVPLLERQRALQEQYYFQCACSACASRKENYSEALLCAACNGPAFVLKESKLICSRNPDHETTSDLETTLQALEDARGHLTAGASFLEQFSRRSEPEDAIAALCATHKADVLVSEHLFPLNKQLVRTKRQMISCYLQMGHHDRALAYTRQLIAAFSKRYFHTTGSEGTDDLEDSLAMPLLQERLRLLKILSLQLEEELEEGSTVEITLKELEHALDDFESTLGYFRSKEESTGSSFEQVFSREIEYAEEKRAQLKELLQK